MLNDKELEEIGKRLYDLEDNPPRGGWEKIASELAGDNPETPPFMWKNGWKFIPLLLIPVLTYWLWPESVPVNQTASSVGTGIDLSKADENASKENATEKAETDSIRVIHNESRHIATQQHDINRIAIPDSNETSSTVSENNPRSEDRVVSRADITAELVRGMTHESTNKKESGLFVDSISFKPDRNDIASVEENNEFTTSKEQVVTDSSDNAPYVAAQEASKSTGGVLKSEEEVSATESNNVELDSKKANLIETAEVFIVEEAEPAIADETSLADARNEAKAGFGPWRISFAAIPQFADQSIRPVVNDETFVTSVGRKHKYPDYTGMGITFGMGRAVRKNLYVDAQLSYTRTKHDVSYTYATGKVDTLLAQLRNDGSVSVIPVYALATSEKDAAFTKGGVRLMATYYFRANPVRRFSLSAGAGVNYLLSAKLTERSTGNVLSSDDYLDDRINYSIFVAAGYNVMLGKGWEVMFSPMLNYNLKKISTGQQPFEFTKRSYGMSVMLSKALH